MKSKTLYVLAVLTLVSMTKLMAQTNLTRPDIFLSRPYDSLVNRLGLKKITSRQFLYNQPIYTLDSTSRASLVDQNRQYKYYRLPIDNMICVTPSKALDEAMVFNLNSDNWTINKIKPVTMPNAINVQPYITDEPN